QAQKDAVLKVEIEQQKKEEQLRKANSFKEKSKNYLSAKSKEIKNKVLEKLNSLKP
ncbi:hypothetical protein MNBD_GAMMA01-560, partial [hydrothermal vent metagenome]